MSEPAKTDAERTSLAWSRTLIGFAAVVGLLAVRGALLEAPTAIVAPLLVLSAALLLVNGFVTSHSLRRAQKDLTGGVRRVRPFRLLLAATSVALLAALSLLLLPLGST